MSDITQADRELLASVYYADGIKYGPPADILNGNESPDTNRALRAISQSRMEEREAVRELLDDILDGLTWNSSPLQCLWRIERLLKDHKAKSGDHTLVLDSGKAG